MGFKLRRWVRNQLPPGLLSQGERAVLLEIADDANDETREAWPGIAELARRVDMDPASVSKCLQRLARKGIEVRVAVGKDGRGRPVYAHSGYRTVYRIPVLSASLGGPPSGLLGGPPSALRPEKGGPLSPEGRTVIPERADHCPQKGGPPSAPSPHVSSKISSKVLSSGEDHHEEEEEEDSLRSTIDQSDKPLPQRLLLALGATVSEAEALTLALTRKHQPETNAWWRTCVANGDLAEALRRSRRGEEDVEPRSTAGRYRGPYRNDPNADYYGPL